METIVMCKLSAEGVICREDCPLFNRCWGKNIKHEKENIDRCKNEES